MNKILQTTIIVLLTAIAISSCKKSSEGVSRITTYADLEMNGPSTLFWQIGEPFVDPGCTATEGETDLTSSIVTKSNVNVSEGGIYTVSYSVDNSDGYAASVIRTVIVYEKTAPLNGYYKSQIARTYNGAVQNRGPFSILIFGVGNDEYYIQDLLGAWYSIGSGYGDAYAGPGIIKLNTNNTFTLISSENLAFSSASAPVFSSTSSYDPATKTLLLNTIMGDTPTMLFKVTLSNPAPLLEE